MAETEERPPAEKTAEDVIREDERSKATTELASSIVTHKQELESKMREELSATITQYREDNEASIRSDERSRPNLILDSPVAWNFAAEILAQAAEGKVALVTDEGEQAALRTCAAELRKLKKSAR